MRQVPPLVLVGDGRLARHLGYYFESVGIELVRWSRRRGVFGVDGEQPKDERSVRLELEELLVDSDRVLLAISDASLERFIERYWQPGRRPWVHFSGCHAIAKAWSAHPLCTFSTQLYQPAFYRTIPFVIESNGPDLEDLIPGLKNPCARLEADRKDLYHAFSVMAGNFTQTLWTEMFRGFEEHLDLEAELAIPYLRQTARNLEEALGRENVATGPIARGDRVTIAKNMAALEAAQQHGLAGVYDAFVALADREDLR